MSDEYNPVKRSLLLNVAYPNSSEFSFFSEAQAPLDQLINQLSSQDYEDNEHGEIEAPINREGQELLRR